MFSSRKNCAHKIESGHQGIIYCFYQWPWLFVKYCTCVTHIFSELHVTKVHIWMVLCVCAHKLILTSTVYYTENNVKEIKQQKILPNWVRTLCTWFSKARSTICKHKNQHYELQTFHKLRHQIWPQRPTPLFQTISHIPLLGNLQKGFLHTIRLNQIP